MERNEFVSEGRLEIGPPERFFVFLNGEYLGKALIAHSGLPEERCYTNMGRVRVTVERLGQEDGLEGDPGSG